MDLKFRLARETHVGLVRRHNEDAVDVWEPLADDERGPIAIVADGLGGHAAGEVASRIALEQVLDTYRGDEPADVTEKLAGGIRSAHERILEYARERPELEGMGTTCTVLAVVDNAVHIAHVGDSRAYRYRDTLEQLTRDHTVAQELADEEVIPHQEVDGHPASHVLTRALGMADSLSIDVLSPPEPLRPGDRFLLCSDGLSGQVSESDIRRALSSLSPETACRSLVELACNAGGPDNISVAILVAEAVVQRA